MPRLLFLFCLNQVVSWVELNLDMSDSRWLPVGIPCLIYEPAARLLYPNIFEPNGLRL